MGEKKREAGESSCKFHVGRLEGDREFARHLYQMVANFTELLLLLLLCSHALLYIKTCIAYHVLYKDILV